jgi:hypothetical protein
MTVGHIGHTQGLTLSTKIEPLAVETVNRRGLDWPLRLAMMSIVPRVAKSERTPGAGPSARVTSGLSTE